ncbi:MAG: RNA polymerase sigma factor RpoD/SigA [bacterium]|nr:RNA polymerase sigma factor RpoD/SigA [bacterium]
MTRAHESLHDVKDSLRRYIEEIATSQPLSAEGEAALARRIKKGDTEARNNLVEANLKFVIAFVRAYQDRGMPLEDLVSAGNIGLIKAADRFDETRGVKFISYAVWWIRQSVLYTLAKYSRLVRLPEYRVDLLYRIFLYINTCQEASFDPTAEEIAGELGVSVEQVTDTMIKAQHVVSLDVEFGDNNGGTLLKTIADSNQESSDAQTMKNSLQDEIEAVLNILRPREQKVIRLYFGLGDKPEMTLEAIGRQFGVTRERARQIKKLALSKLRYSGRAKRLIPYTE